MDVLYRLGEPMPENAVEPMNVALEKPFYIRKENFPDEITFYGPGLKPHSTSEFSGSMKEFVSISVTGNNCALNCEHCNTKMLDNMLDLPSFGGSLFDMAKNLEEKGGVSTKQTGPKEFLISYLISLFLRVGCIEHRTQQSNKR